MKVLGHIHTFNDDDVIDRSLRALLDQTHPVDEVVLVDNASADGTLNRSFPEKVTVIRHQDNRGTSGAVITGFQYGLERGYDWIWILDADSAPRKDALEKLLRLYAGFSSELQAQTRLLASLPLDSTNNTPGHGVVISSALTGPVRPESTQEFYEFDVAMWTGCLFKLSAVREIGLPSADYVLDWGEFEYALRGKRRGYRAFMHQGSILDHNIGGHPSLRSRTSRLGPLRLTTIDFPPIRLYYFTRNILYFWLHEYHRGNAYRLFSESPSIPKFLAKILLMSRKRWPETAACLRGVWDGLWKNMHHRY